jgi:hypothetical protein
MPSAFQNIIDNAETLSFNRKKKVAQTISRDGIVRTTSLGGQTWEFEVGLPDGPSWQTYRPIIEGIEALDRVTAGTIQINKAAHSWINGYQGNLVPAQQTNITVTVSTSSNTTLTITGGGTGLIAGQFRFRAGDLIQLGTTGKVYSVVDDVAHNGTTITVHRPIRDAAGSYTLRVGQAVEWTVVCVQFPQWTIFARDQISWDGPFIFAEVL